MPPGATVVVHRANGALDLRVRKIRADPGPQMSTILIVDDNVAIVRWLMRLFRGRGFEPTPASGVGEARE